MLSSGSYGRMWWVLRATSYRYLHNFTLAQPHYYNMNKLNIVVTDTYTMAKQRHQKIFDRTTIYANLVFLVCIKLCLL
jgi:hypothetical protein